MSSNSDGTATSALAETDSVRTLPLAGVVGTRNGRLHSDHNRNHAGRTTGADPVRVVRIGLRRRAIGHRIRIGFRRRGGTTDRIDPRIATACCPGVGDSGVRCLQSGDSAFVESCSHLGVFGFWQVWRQVWCGGCLPGTHAGCRPLTCRGGAVAVASVGQPIALAIGVPMGAWLGTLADWRVVFAVMSVTALLLVAWILTVMPDFPGQQADRQLPVWKVLVLPGVRPILFVAFLWILAHNIVYTYLAAFLDRIGFGDRLGIVLFVFGLFAFVGIGVVGVFVDRALRSLTVLSLVVFAAALTALGVGGDSFAVIALSVAAWGRGIWRRSHSPSGGARGYDGRRCGHCAIGFRDDLQFGDRSGRRRRRADLGGQGCGSIAVGFRWC